MEPLLPVDALPETVDFKEGKLITLLAKDSLLSVTAGMHT
jgi:hypothetical protein